MVTSIIFASCGKISKPKLSNERDTVSYFIGALQAKGLQNYLKESDYGKFNRDLYVRAFEEVFAGDSIKFTDAQMNAKLSAFFQKLQQENSDKNLKEGEAFLEKNKKNPGVVVLPSGLQYQVIKQGNGPKPDSSDVVSVYYKGTLINGEEFDASKGEPAKFPVRGVIPGMTQALLQMNVGSKWKIFIPANLGYGERVRPGGKIKPNSALIFELEVLGIEPKAPKTEAKPTMQQMMKMMHK
jgi:FKBP-type peptidyl-prolyl cis-trans isomerase FklB